MNLIISYIIYNFFLRERGNIDEWKILSKRLEVSNPPGAGDKGNCEVLDVGTGN